MPKSSRSSAEQQPDTALQSSSDWRSWLHRSTDRSSLPAKLLLRSLARWCMQYAPSSDVRASSSISACSSAQLPAASRDVPCLPPMPSFMPASRPSFLPILPIIFVVVVIVACAPSRAPARRSLSRALSRRQGCAPSSCWSLADVPALMKLLIALTLLSAICYRHAEPRIQACE